MPRSSQQQRKAFGRALAAAMEDKKVTAKGLAEALEVSNQAIYYYRDGAREPTMALINAMEDHLGLPHGTLGQHFQFPTDVPAALTGKMARLSKRKLREVERLVDELLDGS